MYAVFSWSYNADTVRIWQKTVTGRRLGFAQRRKSRFLYQESPHLQERTVEEEASAAVGMRSTPCEKTFVDRRAKRR